MPRLVTQPHELFFATLGNQVRWRIVHLLQSGPQRSTAIAKALRLEQSLASHHLRRLETCGFVHVDRRGTTRTYRLNIVTVRPLLKLMDQHIAAYCRHVLAAKHHHAH